MAKWMKLFQLKLRKLRGRMKDEATIGKAILRSRFPSIHIAVVCATSHEERVTASEDRCLRSIIYGSRVRLSYAIRVLMGRLKKASSFAVALKCLVIIHKGLREGGFPFQEQMASNYSFIYLNNRLSSLKHNKNNANAVWIGWYARFLSQWMLTNQIVGVSVQPKMVTTVSTEDLVKEILAVQGLLQEACFACELIGPGENFKKFLVLKALKMVIQDGLRMQEELQIRFSEIPNRFATLHKYEAYQLLQVCEKLSDQCLKLTQLVELGQGAVDSLKKLLFSEYEIVRMKEMLSIASTQSASASSARRLSVIPRGSLMRSSSLVRTSRESGKGRISYAFQ